MADKYLRVKMSDGSQWDIAALYIARDRAAWYANNDTGENNGAAYDEVYQEEYAYTMENNYELTDWASNNMNWEDVERYANRVQEPVAIDMGKEWVNADKTIISK
jgi:hypothetical protein